MKENKKTELYIDMDDVQCDFSGAYKLAIKNKPEQKYPQAEMDFFRKLKPIKGAVEGMKLLMKSDKYELNILTRPSVHNPLCYTEKRLWVEDHLGIEFCENLMIVPKKWKVEAGGILIDDYDWKNKKENEKDPNWKPFPGEQLLFGSDKFPTWKAVLEHLKP